jgi:hypothetical protein
MDYLISFLVGGGICAIVQIIMDNTKLLPGRIMVGLVCAGAILSFFNLYEPIAEWGKAGAKEGFDEEKHGFGNYFAVQFDIIRLPVKGESHGQAGNRIPDGIYTAGIKKWSCKL